MDKDKAIRSAKLTASGILEKARHATAVTRAGGQIAPSKYLPNVPRAVHADGGYVPQNFIQQTPRLAIARVAQPAQQQQQGPPTLDALASLMEQKPKPEEAPPVTASAPVGSNPMELAKSQIGMSEKDQRGAIQDYLKTGGANLDPVTTAWCAAFVNSTLKQSGAEGTGSNMARSFMQWGNPVTEPQTGDIAVFSRGDPNGELGHVGFFNGYDENGNILVLGGNQGDAVSVSPYSPDQLLGFRRAGYADGGPAMFEGIHPDLQDDQGKPADLYHGTPGEGFDAFDDSKLGSRDAGFHGRGHYLTPTQGVAEGYADPDEMGRGTVMGPLHAALKNPYIWDTSNDNAAHRTLRDLQSMGIMKDKSELRSWDNLQRHHMNKFMGEMQNRGHDGVVVRTKSHDDRPHHVTEIVVFKPNAIKHKDAEVFDPNDPRIMRARGGVTQ